MTIRTDHVIYAIVAPMPRPDPTPGTTTTQPASLPSDEQAMLAQMQAAQAAAQRMGNVFMPPRPPLPPLPGNWDKSASEALRDLNAKPGEISADDLTDAIEKGTKDLDNQAAGTEYAEFAKWASQNQSRLSPEAKQVMATYEKYAMASLQKGQTGIPQSEHNNMIAEMRKLGGDKGALEALEKLDKQQGPISGEDMTKALEEGTKDTDGQAAGAEFREFAKWAEKNQSRLTPEAKQVLETYKKYADAAKAKGESGIPQSEYQKMLGEMKELKTYKDDSARAAIDELNKKQGPISAEDLTKAIETGAADLDGQSAGTEYADFAKWASQNKDRLSPEAQKVMEIYEKHAMKALQGGATGMPKAEFDGMLKEMKDVSLDQSAKAALEKLDKQKGPISAEDMTKAIKEGTQDLDGNSATKEYEQFAKWAKDNESRLTPDAKKVLDLYKQTAEKAKAAGQSGIPLSDYNKMLSEMGKTKTYNDDSVRAALDTLNQKDKVSGFDLLKAINLGTKDLDGQAAGTEYADFAKWAGLNKDRLTPEAQKVLGIYEKYAMNALKAGHTGLTQAENKQMLAEMRRALMPIRPMPHVI